MSKPADISIDIERGTITLYGITYALSLFETLGVAPVGITVQIVSRDDGVLTLRKVEPAQ